MGRNGNTLLSTVQSASPESNPAECLRTSAAKGFAIWSFKRSKAVCLLTPEKFSRVGGRTNRGKPFADVS